MNQKKAAENVATRLLQARRLWNEAADSYFDPSRFQLALQNCITTARTVTFILQSNKSHIPDFELWYEPFRDRWKADQVMRWGINARNAIEKRGDLETKSELRASVIASYLGQASTGWLQNGVFKSLDEILRSIPLEYLEPHVIEHGTLVVERRWVDSELPSLEVLDAVSIILFELIAMVVDLYRHLGEAAPLELKDFHKDGMKPLLMDRAAYISIKDGSSRGFRLFSKEMQISAKKVLRRYKKSGGDWANLEHVENFEDLCEVYFSNARAVLKKDGFHRTFMFFVKDLKVIDIIDCNFPDRASKYLYIREFAQFAKKKGANAVFMIGEAWMAKEENLPNSGFASEASIREEALILDGVTSEGVDIHNVAVFLRKRKRREKLSEFWRPRKNCHLSTL